MRNTDSRDLTGAMFDTSQPRPVSDGIVTFMHAGIVLLAIDNEDVWLGSCLCARSVGCWM
jgi:hypothetical protein